MSKIACTFVPAWRRLPRFAAAYCSFCLFNKKGLWLSPGFDSAWGTFGARCNNDCVATHTKGERKQIRSPNLVLRVCCPCSGCRRRRSTPSKLSISISISPLAGSSWRSTLHLSIVDDFVPIIHCSQPRLYIVLKFQIPHFSADEPL